ncbi:VCBS domain-containing protein [bacterium]|nr:VCBS domain-containing protein [bacterium]
MADGSTITDNILNGTTEVGANYGIYVAAAENVAVSGNTIDHILWGIIADADFDGLSLGSNSVINIPTEFSGFVEGTVSVPSPQNYAGTHFELYGQDNDLPISFSASDDTDILVGTDYDDTLSGNGGDDEIHGGAGADAISGGSGDDMLAGGDGNDELIGGAGNDDLFGEGGNDTLIGGEGNDDIDGGDGVDRVIIDGNWQDFEYNEDGELVDTNGLLGADTFVNVEAVQFNDAVVFVVGNGGYDTLQDAIDAAAAEPAGKLKAIIVAPGEHNVSETGAANISGPALENLVIFGLNLGQSGAERDPSVGGLGESTLLGAIQVNADGVQINGLRFYNGGNVVGQNTALHIQGDNVRVENSTFYRDAGFSNFRAIVTAYNDAAGLVVDDNAFTGWATGLYINPGADATVTNNLFDGNNVALSNDGPDAALIDNNEFANSAAEHIGMTAYNDPSTAPVGAGNTFDASAPEVSMYAGGGEGQVLNGSVHDDVIHGSNLGQEMHGGEGDDTLNGGGGADELYGDAGNDTLNGGGGDDILDGGDDNDVLNGGGGDDVLIATEGEDSVDGGEGTDIAVIADNNGAPIDLGLYDFTGFTVAGGVGSGTISVDGRVVTLSGVEVLEVSDTGSSTFIVADGMSLQAAIDAASDGDTILVRPGSYTDIANYNAADNTNSGTNPLGLLINKSLTIRGVDADGDVITNTADIAATFTSGVQSNWGTNFLVTAPNVTISGLAFEATHSAIQGVNKGFEIYETGFTLENSIVRPDAGTSWLAGPVYFSDETSADPETHVSVITSYKIDGNIFIGSGIYITNGTGAGHDTGLDMQVTDNVFLSMGQKIGISVVGQHDGIAWYNLPSVLPTLVTGNDFSDGVGRYIYQTDQDPARVTMDRAFVEAFIANNTMDIYAYGLTPDGELRVAPQIWSGQSITYAEIEDVPSGVIALPGDTIVVHTDGRTVTDTISVDDVILDITAGSHVEITLGAGVSDITLAGPGTGDVTGNALDNEITGNASVNSLAGGDGDDTLTGGAGGDALDGGAGEDTAVFADTATAPVWNVDHWQVTDGADTDTLAGVEKVEIDDQIYILVDQSGTGGFTTLQAAIEAASDGDVILVAAGTYSGVGNVNVLVDKAVTIRGLGEVTIDASGASSGFTVNLDANAADGTVAFENLTVSGAAGNGIVVPVGEAEVLGTLSLTGVTVENSGGHGLYVTGRQASSAYEQAGVQNLVIIDSTFDHNGLTSGTGSNIMAFEFDGNATLTNVDVTNSALGTTGPASGIQFAGFDASGYDQTGAAGVYSYDVLTAMGNVVFTDVSVTGVYNKYALGIQGYTDTTGLSFVGTENEIDAQTGWGKPVFFDPMADQTPDGAPGTPGNAGSFFDEAGANGSADFSNLHVVQYGAQINEIQGTTQADTITGTEANDAITGFEGADTLAGGEGNDIYVADGSDAIVENVDEGTDLVYAADDITLSANVENLTLVDAASVTETFSKFNLGPIANNENGWAFNGGARDQNIVDVGGNKMLQVSSDPSSSDFAGPYSPGVSVKAGESTTTAGVDSIRVSFTFQAVSAVPDNSSLEVDFATASRTDRNNFMRIENTGTGLRIAVSDPQLDGNWKTGDTVNNFAALTGNTELISGVDPTVAHELTMVLNHVDGQDNDVINIYLDGKFIGQSTSFENYRDALGGTHEANAEVNQTGGIAFRSSAAGAPTDGAGGQNQGFLFDNVTITSFDKDGPDGIGNELDNVITGNSGDNVLSGLGGEDTLIGGIGDDTLIGGGDNDEIDGGLGIDTAVFSGDRADYTITDTLSVEVTGTDGTDHVANVEELKFGDGTLLHAVLTEDTGAVVENNGIDINVLANDFDLDDDTLVVTGVSGGLGEVSINPDGTVRYVAGPAFNFLAVGQSVTDTFTYTVDAGDGFSETGSVTVTITGGNDGPTLAASTMAAEEDGPAVILDLATLGNDVDSDDDGSSLTYTVETQPGAGTASVLGTVLSFDPGDDFQDLAAGEPRQVTIVVKATDDHGAETTANVVVTVTGTNDAPVAVAKFADVIENTSLSASGNLLAGVTDLDTTDEHSVIEVDGSPDDTADVTGTYGSLDWAADGTYTYTLDNADEAVQALGVGEHLTDTFEFTVGDGNGGSDTKTLTVTITGTNDIPVAVADTGTVDEDHSVTIDVLANDTDIDTTDVPANFTLNSATILGGAGGAVSVVGNQLVFSANGDFETLAVDESTTVEIAYEMEDDSGATSTAIATVTVTGVNDQPTASPIPDTVLADFVGVDVSGYFADIDASDALSFSATGLPTGFAISDGVIVRSAGTTIAVGTFAVTVTANDGHGGSVVAAPFNLTVPLDVAIAGASEGNTIMVPAADYAALGELTVNVDNLTINAVEAATGIALALNAVTQLTLAGDADINVTGDAAGQTIVGNNGDNIVKPGAGADWVDGGAGQDTIDYGEQTAGVTVAFGYHAAFGAGIGSDYITGFENVRGGSGNDTLAGDEHFNVFYASAGDDSINGGDGIDTYDASAGTAAITAIMALGTVGGSSLGSDSIVSIENIIGTTFNDNLNGDANDNRLEGRTGNDFMSGGAGNDTLIGDEGVDTLDGGIGDDRLFGNDGNDTLNGGDGNDILKGGNDNDTLNGGVGDDNLSGATGNDILHGNTGNDELYGGQGSDQLFGDDGNDTIYAGDDNDVVDGGDGTDTFVLNGSSGNFTVVLNGDLSGTVTDNVGTEGVNTFSNIEFLRFDGDGVTLSTIPPAPGDDDLDGNGGSDILLRVGGSLIATSGTNTVIGAVGENPADTVVAIGGNIDGLGGDDIILTRASNGSHYSVDAETGVITNLGSPSNDIMSVVDIDGDGNFELIGKKQGGAYQQYSPLDGSFETGFGRADHTLVAIGNIVENAATSDDGQQELFFFNPDTDYVYTVNGATKEYYGTVFKTTQYSFEGLADVDGNGTEDVIVRSVANGSYQSFDGAGNTLQTYGRMSQELVAIADLDGNDIDDLVFLKADGKYSYISGDTVDKGTLSFLDLELVGVGNYDASQDGSEELLFREADGSYVAINAVTNSVVVDYGHLGDGVVENDLFNTQVDTLSVDDALLS